MLFPFSGWPFDGRLGCLDACGLIAFRYLHILYTPPFDGDHLFCPFLICFYLFFSPSCGTGRGA